MLVEQSTWRKRTICSLIVLQKTGRQNSFLNHSLVQTKFILAPLGSSSISVPALFYTESLKLHTKLNFLLTDKVFKDAIKKGRSVMILHLFSWEWNINYPHSFQSESCKHLHWHYRKVHERHQLHSPPVGRGCQFGHPQTVLNLSSELKWLLVFFGHLVFFCCQKQEILQKKI